MMQGNTTASRLAWNRRTWVRAVYGIRGHLSVTLYKQWWLKLVAMAEHIPGLMTANVERLKEEE